MAKESISVKSNGLRNELKEIRKSIDQLTNAILMAQTHTQNEKCTSNGCTCGNRKNDLLQDDV